MPQSDMVGSISYKQKRLILRLVEEIDSFDQPWFPALKDGRTDIDEMSAATASDVIEALLEHQKKTQGRPANTSTHVDSEELEEKDLKPVSENQIKYLLDLLEKKQLANDGVIDVDHWLSRLTSSTASHLIDAVKFTPQLESQTG